MNEDRWEDLKDRFRDHFRSSAVTAGEGFIEFESDVSRLKVGRDGSVNGDMPLHSFSGFYESVEFGEDEVRFLESGRKYVFRK
ncbi:MAG: hypothetical protein ABEK01_02125 [Candidatus Nanohaloarchaea archaeon]